MEIRDLRFFCLTAELEHVSKAADMLGVSQPFMTKVIGQLEKEVGAPLFDNIGRKIKLNKLGETFYTGARKLLVDFDKLQADMDHLIDRRERTISVLSDTEAYTTSLVLALSNSHPDMILSITYGSRQEIMDAVSTGKTDFAICTPPIADDPMKGLKTDIVFCERGCIMLPPDHPLLNKEVISLEDIQGENLITSPKGAGMRDNIDRLFKKHGVRPQIICESNDMGMIIKVVGSGLGYAFMARSQMIRDPALWKLCVDIDVPDAVGDIGLTYNENADFDKNFVAFRNFIRAFFKSLN